MATVLRRSDGGDPLRRYWWLILLVVVIGGGGALLGTRRPGTEPAPDPELGPGSDQSLESIGAGLPTIGAPGGALNLSMEGSYRRQDEANSTQKSSLFEAPAPAPGAGAPVVASAAAASAEGGSLADALKKVASAKPSRENKGWGDAIVRTGFAPPRAKFSALSGPGGAAGAGGSSGASFAARSVTTPFGLPASNPGLAAGSGAGVAGLGGPKVRKGGRNQAFDLLKQVEKTAGQAMQANADLASNLGNRGFDGGAKAAPSLAPAGGVPLGHGGVAGRLEGVPENLKLDDPKLQKKELKVPEIKAEKDAPAGPDMSQMLTMMLMQMAIAGIAGPMFGAIGMTMASAMGANMYGSNFNFGPTQRTY
ncbi:MAG: hypothetical protein HY554_04795 [Elusimicrobia bacterium]|nr:hypothetical protein [Elusimicrobiota bacterium]